MNHRNLRLCTVATLLLGISPLTHAGGAVDITIDNNTGDDLRVTLYDLNARPAQRVISRDVINGFAKLHLSVVPDAAGYGHVSWTAHTVGSGSQRRCARHEKAGLASGAIVHVYANKDCPSPIR